MYEVTIKAHFDAAHALRGYGGKCERLHGHRFQVAVCVAAEETNEIGLAYDFTELKRILRERVISHLDHTNLNETPPFDEINPSSENIARFVYEEMKKALTGVGAQHAAPLLRWVRVWESPNAWVTYYGDEEA
ncbi:MAG: 6-carboxytetrahydropterin synthase QueD [Chloroflexota bacterium]|nr:6-carboxytetrahydropterin synthase QueD [Chloroflexota bacterium]